LWKPKRQKFHTDLVVLQQAARDLNIKMSTSPEASPVNGHASPSEDEHMDDVANDDRDQSDSDLSDVQAADDDADPQSPDTVDVAGLRAGKPVLSFQQHVEDSGSSDHDASNDADFDMADSPASAHSNGDNSRAASTESRPAPKRKAVEEDFMRENPELYGLRRSV
jgi:chromodomain-helicase-DNA-binding protein 1